MARKKIEFKKVGDNWKGSFLKQEKETEIWLDRYDLTNNHRGLDVVASINNDDGSTSRVRIMKLTSTANVDQIVKINEMPGLQIEIISQCEVKNAYILFDDGGEIEPDTGAEYLCLTAEENAEFKINADEIEYENKKLKLKYSTDRISWHEVEFTEISNDYVSQVFELKKGDKIYFKGKNPNGFDDYDINFDINYGKIAASGDLGTLIDEMGGEDLDLSETRYAFYDLFSGSSDLTQAPNLLSTKLGAYCCSDLFEDCISLKQASFPPATKLPEGCYNYMYYGCSNLESIGDITVEEYALIQIGSFVESSFEGIFSYCENLKSIGNITVLSSDNFIPYLIKDLSHTFSIGNINAVDAGERFFKDTFKNNSYIESIGDINVQNAGDYCFDNFLSGSSIKKIGNINVANAGQFCFNSAFTGCSSLEEVGDIHIANVKHRALYELFKDNTSLLKVGNIYIGEADTSLDQYICYNAFSGCVNCEFGDITLESSMGSVCIYKNMFKNCLRLTKQPLKILNDEIHDESYSNMFDGCTFPMSDDGEHFNFEFSLELPYALYGTIYSTHYDIAVWMGNTTGFNQ